MAIPKLAAVVALTLVLLTACDDDSTDDATRSHAGAGGHDDGVLHP